MYILWIDFRDRINNILIRFLLNHCYLDCASVRKFVYLIPNIELQTIINEKHY
jgi:hypothetical protein